MGSPITLSGFNQIDWDVILNAVMQQERQPATQLEAQKRTLETQNTALGTLLGRLNGLDAAISTLRTTTSVTSSTARSSSANITVSAGSGAVNGTYAVVVSTLAQAQVMASSSTYGSLDAVVSSSGSLTFTPATSDPVSVAVTADMTLAQLAAAINISADAPATASVVQTRPGCYQLVLTGKHTGADNAFTLTSTLNGGEGLAFGDTDADTTYGNSAADLVQAALNAQFTVNGLPVQSAHNIATGAIPGTTLTLKKADPSEPVTISVTRDDDEAVARLTRFMGAYNDLVQFMQGQDTAGTPRLSSHPLLRSFRSGIRSALQAHYPTNHTFTQLAQIGVGFDRDGTLTLDRTVYDSAMSASATDVQTLLSGVDGTGGVFGALEAAVDEYAQAGGLISLARGRIAEQVKGLTTRLDAFDARLTVRRAALQKQFLEAERLMSQLTSQGTSLSQLGSRFGSF